MSIEVLASRHRHYCGAREVLCVSCERIGGDTPLAAHVSALCDALEGYAEREIVPIAADQLRALTESGRGYTFCPYTYAVTVRVKKRADTLGVTLRATHTQGERVLSRRVLRMRWNAAGTLQYRARREKKE